MTKALPTSQNPLILKALRLIEAFAKSNDERDFFIDRIEGFIIYVDLDKPEDQIEVLENELHENKDRYFPVPKMSFYETKKIMEGFVNEKVYDIDTKEKLLDLIDSKDARENFLEFIYDQHTELEKWQQFYQERSRIRIIEWLRSKEFDFVFEEDLELNIKVIEKLKEQMFETKVGKEIVTARKTLIAKAKTYYSNEALNPRPKRGRPPKLQAKQEIDQQTSADVYTTVNPGLRHFLFTPDISGVSAATFSEKYGTEEELLKGRGLERHEDLDEDEADINKKLAALRSISSKWVSKEESGIKESAPKSKATEKNSGAIAKKPLKMKEEKPAKSTKPSPEKTKPKPVKTIIKKPEESDTNSAKKTPSKKRIMPKELPKETKKRPLKKIMPTTSDH